MKFKKYLTESVIIPDKIKIKTHDVKKLNKQFKDYPVKIIFKQIDNDTEPAGGYVPKNNQITISINDNVPYIAIESLIQHELIHYLQDKKSGNRMQADIEKSARLMKQVIDKVDELEDTEHANVAIPALAKEYLQLRKKAQFLNDEERMTYAYMFVYLRNSDNIHEVIKEANKMWIDLTDEKMNKKMLKYFYLYWQVKELL